jgi:hypothetical protein
VILFAVTELLGTGSRGWRFLYANQVGTDRAPHTPARVWAGPLVPTWSRLFFSTFVFFLFPVFLFFSFSVYFFRFSFTIF